MASIYPGQGYRRNSSPRPRKRSPRGSHDAAAGAGAAAAWLANPWAHPGQGLKPTTLPGAPVGNPWRPGKSAPWNTTPRGSLPYGGVPRWGGGVPVGTAFALARMGLGFLPWMVLGGLAAYLMFQWWKSGASGWGLRVMGYTLRLDCNRRDTIGLRTTGTTTCLGTQPWGTAWNGVSFPANLFTKDRVSPTFARPDRWYERTTVVVRPRVITEPIWDPFDPNDPSPAPQLQPEGPPKVQPGPLPEPLPPAYVPLQPDWSPHSPEPTRFTPEAPTAEPGYPWPDPFWPVPHYPAPAPQPQPPVKPGTAQPNPMPQPSPQPQPVPVPVPPPTPGPVTVIPPAWEIPPFGPIKHRPPENRPDKPPEKTKEKKVSGGYATGVLAVALNLITEGADYVDAFWWALPPQYRSPPKWDPWQGKWYSVGVLQKMQDIYDNAEHLDMDKAIDNVYDAMGEDAFYGTIGKLMGKANAAAFKSGYAPNSGFTYGRGPLM